MSEIVNLLTKRSLESKCFVHYFIDDERLEYPFLYQNTNNNFIEGLDFVFNKPLKLDSSIITGFSEFKEEDNNFNKKVSFIKDRYNAIQVLLNDYKFNYSSDIDKVIYSDNPYSTFLIAFDAKNSLNLKTSDNIASAKSGFKNIIQKAVERAKTVIMSEIESYRAENQESESEINMILDILNEVVNNLDLDQETPFDLIMNSWPALLAPNPFMVYS